MKKTDMAELSSKSTKDQILAAYQDALVRLNAKQIDNPQESKKQQAEKAVVEQAAAQSPDVILSDLSSIKLKSIKQLDTLSEELLREFQKLSDIRQAIVSEQKHLKDLYQINETANTLAALLQTHHEQKEQFEREMEQQKKEFDQSIATQSAHWKEERDQLEREFREHKTKLEKERKREEEEYAYTLVIKRRKEMDEYNTTKTALEKELAEMRESLQKREEIITEKEQALLELQARVDRFPEELNKAIADAEEKLRTEILQKHTYESQLTQKEYDGGAKLYEQQVSSLQEKIKQQEALIRELNQKADQATQQVQLIACRALDASAQRFLTTVNVDEKTSVANQK